MTFHIHNTGSSEIKRGLYFPENEQDKTSTSTHLYLVLLESRKKSNINQKHREVTAASRALLLNKDSMLFIKVQAFRSVGNTVY